MDWDAHAEREEGRYSDGLARLPEDLDGRQKQLVRVAMAAGGAGLARLMQGRSAEAAGWLSRSAERYRQSWEGAVQDARWALEQRPQESDSPIGAYAAVLALLTLAEDEQAAALAPALRHEAFPEAVGDALASLSAHDRDAYATSVARVLESFEIRGDYLEDIPVADTVLVLEALAARRSLAAGLKSALLP